MSHNHRLFLRDNNSRSSEASDMQMDPSAGTASPNLQSAPANVPNVAFIPRNHAVPGNPPPIPPRLQHAQVYRSNVPAGYSSYMPSYNRYSSMTSGYGNMGYNSSRYGYPFGYNQSYGDPNDAESAFLRMAEESSRPAFQSIESLVNAVGSISMMLDSTYHAIFSSYRAVLGVVESFSRLKNHFAQVLSTLALLRTFQWLIQRVLYFLRLRKDSPSVEAAWSAASTMASGAVTGESNSPPHSSMLFLVFVSLAFGAPWLISRIFSRMAAKVQPEKPETQENEQVFVVALYNFQASHRGEMQMRVGQRFLCAPKSQQPRVKGWLKVQAEDGSTGVVPATYLRLYKMKQRPNSEQPQQNNPGPSTAPTETVVPTEEDQA